MSTEEELAAKLRTLLGTRTSRLLLLERVAKSLVVGLGRLERRSLCNDDGGGSWRLVSAIQLGVIVRRSYLLSAWP